MNRIANIFLVLLLILVTPMKAKVTKNDVLLLLNSDEETQNLVVKYLRLKHGQSQQRMSEEAIDNFFKPASLINPGRVQFQDHGRRKRKSYQWIKTPRYSSYHTHSPAHNSFQSNNEYPRPLKNPNEIPIMTTALPTSTTTVTQAKPTTTTASATILSTSTPSQRKESTSTLTTLAPSPSTTTTTSTAVLGPCEEG